MKKFDRLIVIFILLYVIMAGAVYMILRGITHEQDHHHMIEANRIMAELDDETQLDSFSYQEYDSIQKIEYLAGNTQDESTIQDFYRQHNRESTMIQPWYRNHQLIGYLKFTYKPQNTAIQQIIIWMEIILFLIAVMIIALLFYIRKNVIQPFQQITQLPMQLAHGHYKESVRAEKSRYFNEYLLGMGQLKDQLDIAQKRQYELLKEKKQLLLSISHDIKTPLNLIKLYGRALEDDVCDEVLNREKAVHQIGVKCDEIEGYVETIIRSSREDILNLEVASEDFYLHELMHNVLHVYEEQCRLRNIDCHVGAYQDRLLKGDLHRAQEVMENLFENAFKYGDGRRIDITFYEEDYCQLIRIFNTGSVVANQEFNHLFDSFYRGTNAQGKQGSGLGLYICRQLMRKMDGDIYAEICDGGMAFVLVFR